MQTTKRDYNKGTRSTAYNDRHRTWGYNCPAMDWDALEGAFGLAETNTFTEFSKHTGVRRCYANMEIKHFPEERLDAFYSSWQMEVLLDAVYQARPLYGVEWTTVPASGGGEDEWYFHVKAWNEPGREKLQRDEMCMNERWYIHFLYGLRGLTPPEDVLARLPKKKCPEGLFGK